MTESCGLYTCCVISATPHTALVLICWFWSLRDSSGLRLWGGKRSPARQGCRVICCCQPQQCLSHDPYAQWFIFLQSFLFSSRRLSVFNMWWHILPSMLLISLSEAWEFQSVPICPPPIHPLQGSADVISKIGPWLITARIFFPNHRYSEFLEANVFVDAPGIPND